MSRAQARTRGREELDNEELLAVPGTWASGLVNLFAVRDAGNGHKRLGVIQHIDDAVIARVDAPLVFVLSELLAPWGSGIVSKGHNLAVDPRKALPSTSSSFWADALMSMENLATRMRTLQAIRPVLLVRDAFLFAA